MGKPVIMTANLACTFGLAPSTLIVIPTSKVFIENKPAGTIMNNKPNNIPPFGMCNSLMNPTVAAATIAALGVLTPMPCLPVVAAPWMPGSPTVKIGKMAVLTDSCKATCNWGGMISITNPGSTTTSCA